MNSQFIEVGIGLVFVFLLMSILVSAVNEMIMSAFSGRGKFLKDAIARALEDPQNKSWSLHFYEHPLIDILKKNKKRLPAYISSQTFAVTLIDLISAEGRSNSPSGSANSVKDFSQLEKFRSGLSTLNDSRVKKMLELCSDNCNDNYDRLKELIGNWFDEYMDRVGGWYKRKMKKFILLFSFVITVVMNVDTIQLSIQLWNNAALRETMVIAAETYVENNGDKFNADEEVLTDTLFISRIKKDTVISDERKVEILDSLENVEKTNRNELTEQMDEIKETYHEFNMLNLPIGWVEQNNQVLKADTIHDSIMTGIEENSEYNGFQKWWFKNLERISHYTDVVFIYLGTVTLMKLFGWIFTAIAVSFGAPYWFDMLNKLINVRGTGKTAKKIVAAVKPPVDENQ